MGGPNQSPFSCPPGTSCGTADISGIGHASYQLVNFNVCGFGCHHRTVYFDDGSTLVIQVEDQPSGFAFTSLGATGSGSGRVALHGGVAIGKTSGTITVP